MAAVETSPAPIEPPAVDALPTKTAKVKVTKAPKEKKALHPTYLEMIREAIASLKERTGSSQYAISKFVEDKHKAHLPANFKKLLPVQHRKLTAAGKLTKVKNSYKIAAKPVTSVKKTAVSAKLKTKSAVTSVKKTAVSAKLKTKSAAAKPKSTAVKPKKSVVKQKPKASAVKPKTAAKSKAVATKPKTAGGPAKVAKGSAKAPVAAKEPKIVKKAPAAKKAKK